MTYLEWIPLPMKSWERTRGETLLNAHSIIQAALGWLGICTVTQGLILDSKSVNALDLPSIQREAMS